MLIYSMGVSVDGFVKDRQGNFAWLPVTDDRFRYSLEQVSELGCYLLGRRLYEDMLVWENDPAMRTDADRTAFAEVWSALPKVVFSRTLTSVQGNARLAQGTVAEEVAAALGASDQKVSIGGPDLAGQAIELGLVEEFHIVRYPLLVGGGTPYLPAVAKNVPLRLAETRTFEQGVVYEFYQRA
ncbi:dihydrofolate reductase family protein [Kineosporia babensis]|uniref:Dihydrofolate reductase family protein n=1 Tax=Kineosporia babensis TaxID=499548 RepID=A0A9X1STH1_9ACTN|nr:dihydrofolate reductase family protein [Kineosporia babensis]MCD5311874.1 dihydrofolate reductase family protein [Kineosporia babensis]